MDRFKKDVSLQLKLAETQQIILRELDSIKSHSRHLFEQGREAEESNGAARSAQRPPPTNANPAAMATQRSQLAS